MGRGTLCCLISLLFFSSAQAEKPVPSESDFVIGEFSNSALEHWQPKIFSGETQYDLVLDKTVSPPRTVLRANSNGAASGLFFKQRIDLEKQPWLNWSWKTEGVFSNLDERQKRGDDFVARLYIVVDGGLFFWNTRALNYVWSSSAAVGESWPNPFTSNAVMLAVESGEKHVGQWRYYRRNVRADLKKLLGKEVRYIDAVAVMTDSDNAGQQATTYYGDVYFSATP
ncbi:MAG: DUF3047 domain-containing protein [Gammaproteobacteria bacterium]|nr:DUF3047 domain-containing protein [Gammaproteobacteria bacterium]